MRHGFLGGLAVVLALVAPAAAQTTPGTTPQYRPYFKPAKPAEPVELILTSASSQVPTAPQPAAATSIMPEVPPSAAPTTSAAPGSPASPAKPVEGNYHRLPSHIKQDIASACSDETAGSCDNLCGSPGRMWLGGEWLLWTTKGNYLPPLLTSAPVGATLPGAGTLGGAGTQLLVGNQGFNDNWRSGLRVTGGIWLDPEQRLGIEGEFLFLGQGRQLEQAGSNGTSIVTRPFINNTLQTGPGLFTPVAPFQDSQLVAFPNTVAGTTTVNASTDFIGGGANFVRNLLSGPTGRFDFLIGYRYLNLNDTLMIEENLTAPPQTGTTFVVQDRFRTENHFNGGVLGFAYERRLACAYLSIRSSVALGATRTIVDIDGATTSAAGVRQTATGGLLAQPSNIGRYDSTRFSVVPEIGVRLGLQVTDHFRVYAGYNFLYWNNVTRTGEAIDLRVNSSQIPPGVGQTGPIFPQYSPRTTDFWTHGVMIGTEIRY